MYFDNSVTYDVFRLKRCVHVHRVMMDMDDHYIYDLFFFLFSYANRIRPSDRHGKTPGIKTVTLDAVVTTTQLMSVKSAAGYV